jgi:hypothetical protein
MNLKELFKFLDNNTSRVLITSLPSHTGGKFVTSLLDGHPELLTLPWAIHRIINKSSSKSYEGLFKEAKVDDEFAKTFALLSGSSFEVDFFNITNDEVFTDYRFLLAFTLCAYAQKSSISHLSKVKHVVFHSHDVLRTIDFRDSIQPNIIIAIARHPCNAITGAFKKLQRSALNPTNYELLRPYRFSPYLIDFHKLFDFPDYHKKISIFSLEQLHYRPHESTAKLSTFLNISHEPSMLNSTLQGKTWEYKGAAGTRTSFSSQHRKIDNKLISKALEKNISYSCKNIYQLLGYKTNDPNPYTNWFNLFIIFDSITLRWYCDFIFSYLKFLKNEPSLKKKIKKTTTTFLKLTLTYPLLRLKDNFTLMYRIPTININCNLENLHVINFPEQDAMSYE